MSCTKDEISKSRDEQIGPKSITTRSNIMLPILEEYAPGVEKETILLRNGMTVKKLDSLYIYQGDMILSKEQVDELNNPTARGAIINLARHEWPNHTVYYSFEPGFEFVQEAYEAMTTYHLFTNIIFLPATEIQANKVRFFHGNEPGAYSFVGMQGGVQDIKIGREYWFNAKGTIMHELGHAIGLIHEQSKADRDNYINVNYNNIKTDSRGNFDITPNQAYLYGFDFESIMLYGSFSGYEIDSKTPSLTKKDGSTWTAQRRYFSLTDQMMLRYKYPDNEGSVRIFQIHAHETNGAGIEIADINNNGKADMVVAYTDVYTKTSSTFERALAYVVLYDMDQHGNPTSVGGPYGLSNILNDSNENFGVSVSAADLNNNGYQDLIFMYGRGAQNTPKTLTYRVAFDVGMNGLGTYGNLSNEMSFPGLGYVYNGIGIDTYDFNNNGKPDLIFTAYDDAIGGNTFRYQIAYDLDENGNVKGGVSARAEISGIGDLAQGAGITVGDIDKNGKPDLLFMCIDSPTGLNNVRYAILWNVNSSGQSSTAAQYYFLEKPFMNIGYEHQGGDCALYDINKDGILDCFFMGIDNPSGANTILYMTGLNINTSGKFTSWKN